MTTDFIYEIISATCFGVSNAYWKKLEQAGYSFLESIFYRSIIAVALLIVLFVSLHYWGYGEQLVYINKRILQNNHWLYTLLICIFCSMGLLCYVSSLKYKIVAVAVSLSSINIFGILAATFIFSEAFLANQFVSLLIATAGIVLISLKPSANLPGVSYDIRSILLPILASFFWGIGYTLFKVPLQWMGAFTLSLLIEGTVLALSFFMLLATKGIKPLRIAKAFAKPHFYVAAVFLLGGSVFVNIALTKLSVVTINILGLLTFPVSIFFAFVIGREKPTFREWIGIFFIVSSILFFIIFNQE